MTTMHKRVWYCALWLLAACGSAEQVNIGDTGVLGAKLSDYAGRWEGYAEAYEFDGKDDTVRLRLEADGTGTLEVGTEPVQAVPMPPALDPALNIAGEALADLHTGFAYSVHSARVDAKRIRLETDGSAIYSAWCGTFEPTPSNGPGLYNCLGATQAAHLDGQLCAFGADGQAVGCGQAQCLFVCDCSAERCETVKFDSRWVRFDGALTADGHELVGTLATDKRRVTLRFTKE